MVTAAFVLVLLAFAGVLIASVVRRSSGWGEPKLRSPAWADDDIDEDDDPRSGGSGVREPRRPLPSGGAAATAADPDDRAA